MRLAAKGKEIPPGALHDPLLKNMGGDTVAMILTRRGDKIPEEWKHDENLTNNSKESIAAI